MTAPFAELELLQEPDLEVRDFLAARLLEYNQAELGPAGIRPLVVAVRDAAGSVVGGLWGRTSFGWLYIELLFLPEAQRGQRLGSQLLAMAEAEAMNRRCAGAWLDTFSDRAARFYRQHGYEDFGRLREYPPGNTRWFMRKSLPQTK